MKFENFMTSSVSSLSFGIAPHDSARSLWDP
jgi:hypothetical protein